MECSTCGGTYDGALCVRCLARFAESSELTRPSEQPLPEIPGVEILEPIGRGGMSVVYKARQGERVVALKVLSAPELAARFEREAEALGALSHPNIVRRYGCGRAGDALWIAMEFVEGDDLRRRLRPGRLPPDEALRIATEVCDALEYAHGRGVLHRDIKPENVLLDRTSRVKLADFGLAKLAGGANLTGSGAVLGTTRYMAPEQAGAARDVDARADLYSLGAVFYEMLTGISAVGRFLPPAQKAGVDPRFDRVVLKLLCVDPAGRHASAAELRADLEKLARPPSLLDRVRDKLWYPPTE